MESINFIVDVKLTDEKRNGSLIAYLTENRLSNANNTVIDAARVHKSLATYSYIY